MYSHVNVPVLVQFQITKVVKKKHGHNAPPDEWKEELNRLGLEHLRYYAKLLEILNNPGS